MSHKCHSRHLALHKSYRALKSLSWIAMLCWNLSRFRYCFRSYDYSFLWSCMNILFFGHAWLFIGTLKTLRYCAKFWPKWVYDFTHWWRLRQSCSVQIFPVNEKLAESYECTLSHSRAPCTQFNDMYTTLPEFCTNKTNSVHTRDISVLSTRWKSIRNIFRLIFLPRASSRFLYS